MTRISLITLKKLKSDSKGRKSKMEKHTIMKSIMFQAFLIYESGPLQANPWAMSLIKNSIIKLIVITVLMCPRITFLRLAGSDKGYSIVNKSVDIQIRIRMIVSKCLWYLIAQINFLKLFSGPKQNKALPSILYWTAST